MITRMMPQNQRLLRPYIDFRGGLNVDAAPDSLADNELMQADNIDLDERGSAAKRKGTVPLNETSYEAEVEKLIEWPKNDGTKVLLAIIGTTLAKIEDDGTKTDIKVLSDKNIGYFFFQDKFYFTGKETVGEEETDKYWVYDGTDVIEVVANEEVDNDLEPIKRCRVFIWHPKNMRVFAALDANDKAALYYSEPNDPAYFKETSKLYPTTGDGPVVTLTLFGDAMLAKYQDSDWAWKGVNPYTDAEWVKLPVGQGTTAADSVVLTPNSLTSLGLGGLYSLNPGLLDYNIVMVTGDELVKNRAINKVANIIRSIVHPETARAVFDKLNERYLLAYGDDPDEPRNNKVLVLDWGLQSFTKYTGWQVNDFLQRSNGDLLVASNGYILKTGQGYKDFDVTTGKYKQIKFHVKTKHYCLSSANMDLTFYNKVVSRLLIRAKQFDAEASSIELYLTADYRRHNFDPLPLDESLAWGETWGNLWGWSDLVTKEAVVKAKGMRFQLEFVNEKINEPVVIYGVAFMFEPRKAKGVRVS